MGGTSSFNQTGYNEKLNQSVALSNPDSSKQDISPKAGIPSNNYLNMS